MPPVSTIACEAFSALGRKINKHIHANNTLRRLHQAYLARKAHSQAKKLHEEVATECEETKKAQEKDDEWRAAYAKRICEEMGKESATQHAYDRGCESLGMGTHKTELLQNYRGQKKGEGGHGHAYGLFDDSPYARGI